MVMVIVRCCVWGIESRTSFTALDVSSLLTQTRSGLHPCFHLALRKGSLASWVRCFDSSQVLTSSPSWLFIAQPHNVLWAFKSPMLMVAVVSPFASVWQMQKETSSIARFGLLNTADPHCLCRISATSFIPGMAGRCCAGPMFLSCMHTMSKRLAAIASMSSLQLEKPSMLIDAIDSAVPDGAECLWRFGIVIY